METKQKNIQNKAEYYFGSKIVVDRAAEENEFEGSYTTEEDMENIIEQNQLLAKLSSEFWRRIFAKLIAVCHAVLRRVVDDDSSECVEISFRRADLTGNSPPFKPRLFRKVENAEDALKLKWEWSRHMTYIYELKGPLDLEEAILSFLLNKDGDGYASIYVRVSELDPPTSTTCNDWSTFWKESLEVTNDLMAWKGRPMRVAAFSSGDTIIAQKERDLYYVVVSYIQYSRSFSFK